MMYVHCLTTARLLPGSVWLAAPTSKQKHSHLRLILISAAAAEGDVQSGQRALLGQNVPWKKDKISKLASGPDWNGQTSNSTLRRLQSELGLWHIGASGRNVSKWINKIASISACTYVLYVKNVFFPCFLLFFLLAFPAINPLLLFFSCWYCCLFTCVFSLFSPRRCAAAPSVAAQYT